MHRVLIANRGEIACRIIRTLDRMGLESVAVYSDAERGALHVGMATQRVEIGPAPPTNSYLSMERLLAAAEATRADAIHPGYGFLAEHAEFAAAVERAGLAFIGPTPDQLRAFGAKDTARALAAEAGVPLLPGSAAFASVDDAARFADTVGFPLLVKSVAGGGGIGMVRCDSRAELADAVTRAVRQAEQSFGDPNVFLERLVAQARHIEVQVFGDGQGRVVVLGDRDCSTQRRRQKVIEEAPAPNLDDETRAALGDAARRLLEPVQYRSAGTVEFVVDAESGAFYFLEVNTRLQVEHGVTEAITGVDLVEWMVDLARGNAEPVHHFEAGEVGHAIEVRVYAEDPAKGFLPCAGLITEARWPLDVRVDTWVTDGVEITPYYDPLLAKLVVHGKDRANAVDRLHAALATTQVSGIETNLDLLRSFIATDAFARAAVTTDVLEQHHPQLATIEVIAAGASTTVQDLPGRLGYWHVGVPPSGPMDDHSFALGNLALGNERGAPGLECTANGPTLRFNTDAVICLAGADMQADLDGRAAPWWKPFDVPAGSTLRLGALAGAGLRAYVLVRGGFAVPSYLGSAATFTLGGFGGHGGRELRAGDVLHVGSTTAARSTTTIDDAPDITRDWELGVLDGPHGAPDFLTADGIDALYAATWQVHYNSSRTGVRLIGPKPDWARTDGGEAGLHPSNLHDTAYTVGAVDFTGDMPIILGPDGPSLGGFVCPLTVTTDERWKIGQLAPGDAVRFVRASDPTTTRDTRGKHAPAGAALGERAAVLGVRPAVGDVPAVTYRRAGDRALLVEYGPMTLDLDLRLRAHSLADWVANAKLPGVVEATPGIRSLQLQVDGATQTVDSLLDALRTAENELPALDDLVVPSRLVHLPLSWDDPATREAIDRYMHTVRDDAPWCPWNIEFIRRINGLPDVDDVRRIVYDAEYLVLGLGDVYLGAPVSVPVDPRHRLVTTKYNPARPWTPENAVGIGGAYLCIYGMEGPGGYQFVGRTVPVWHRFGATAHTTAEQPWLLRFFDRIRWYPVGADELLELRAESRAGRLTLAIEDGTFSRAQQHAFLAEHDADITRFRASREAAFRTERDAWEQSGELARAEASRALPSEPVSDPLSLPDGAVVVESSLHAAVWRIHVDEGQVVGPGEVVVTVEAMKMETAIVAPTGGIVSQIVCEPGQVVMPGSPLVVLVADA